ncbi:hypothetical protein BGZ76_006443 [Entomortierella beljakovae]|nr:hypothetical protein BGZ76_006443 [Entomortierella beljakovae]
MGNLVKLKDDATQKLWIEIASQVLNGFFTLANVPVHPKRFLGLIHGLRIKRSDNALRKQFLDQFLNQHMESKVAPKVSREDGAKELLDMLDFYRCFSDYGHIRGTKELKNQIRSQPTCHSSTIESIPPMTQVDEKRGNSTENSEDISALHTATGGQSNPINNSDTTFESTNTESSVHVGVTEEAIQELVSEETNRVVNSVVLPFLPFPINTANTNSTKDEQTPPMQEMEQENDLSDSLPLSTQSRRTVVREMSSSSISRATSKRTIPRTKARTMSMSLSKEGDSSAFFVHEAISEHSADTTNGSVAKKIKDSSQKKGDEPRPLVPMPSSLTKEQMYWVDNHQVELLKLQENVQKGWPWYNYTIPEGIEPVDFLATPGEVALAKIQETNSLDKSTISEGVELDAMSSVNKSSCSNNNSSPSTTMIRSSPSDHVVTPSRFCLIVGLFNINSFVQEILCGFMWGMNYHVRPGWVVGTGMAVGCLAAIIPSVLIMLHEHALGHVRVVATTEEAINSALNDKP